jgi:hypothetical protein
MGMASKHCLYAPGDFPHLKFLGVAMSKSGSSQKAKRMPYLVPRTLIDELNLRADKHLPPPKRRHFLQFLLEYGLSDYAHGIMLEKEMFPRPNPANPETGTWARFEHRIDPRFHYRLRELHAEHLPKTSRRAFFEHIIMLGLQAYEKEYTIYGFKRDN